MNTMPREYIISRLEECLDMTQIQRFKLQSLDSGDIEPDDLELFLIEVDLLFADKKYDELMKLASKLPMEEPRAKVIMTHPKLGELTYSEYLDHIHKWTAIEKTRFKTLQELSDGYSEYAKEWSIDSAIGKEDELLHMGLQYHRLMGSIYTVRLKEGGTRPFVMNHQQRILYRETTLVHPRMVLLKSRQTGASTLYLIKGLDDILTRSAFEAGLQANGLEEAKSLKSRADLAYNSMPSWFNASLSIERDTSNKQELSFSNESKLRVATSFRSATLNSLHVSELGKIAETDPKKIEELRTGTMQAIKVGNQITFESTAMGEDNYFHELWEQSVESRDKMGPTDFNPVFLSLWDDNDCRVPGATLDQIGELADETPQEIIDYLLGYRDRYKEEMGKDLAFEEESPEHYERFLFWLQKVKEFGYDMSKMNQEYPDVPSAAFAASKDSSYYSSLLNQMVKSKGHIKQGVYDSYLDVYAAMDLGMNDTMVIIWFQVQSREIRIIDAYGNSGEALGHYANVLRRYKNLKRLYLPHDANVRDLSAGESRVKMFRDLGITNITVLPKTNSVQDDIELVRSMIPIMWFEKSKTATLYKKLTKYQKKWDEVNEVFKNEPLHNEASNWADALRYMVVAIHKYMRAMETGRKPKKMKSNVVDGLAL